MPEEVNFSKKLYMLCSLALAIFFASLGTSQLIILLKKKDKQEREVQWQRKYKG